MKKRVIESILATVAVVSCVFTAVACSKENVAVKEDTRQEQTYGGMWITESSNGGISLLSAELCATEYEAYGVSTLADSAYTLTATITPSNATNKAVDWSIAWSNAASSWAKGKSVGDYVTLAAKTEKRRRLRNACGENGRCVDGDVDVQAGVWGKDKNNGDVERE